MAFNRTNEIEIIRRGISLPLSQSDSKNIILIHGMFGTGKSFLVKQLEAEIISKKIADGSMSLPVTPEDIYLHDLVKLLLLNFKTEEETSKKILWTECNYNIDRFSKLLEYLKENNDIIFKKLNDILKLKSEAGYYISKNQNIEELPDINFEEELNELLDNKGDRRLILNTGDVLAESIIIDLMTAFHPFNTITEVFENNNEPEKIVFIFDNYEKINWSAWQWLSQNLIPYCTAKKFSEFISYDISNSVQSANISDYLDFRFIITSRENLSEKKNIAGFNIENDNCISIELKPLSKDEIPEFLENSDDNNSPDLENVYSATKGIPLILSLYSESFKLGSTQEEKSNLNEKVSEVILTSKTEEEKDWLRCISFLDTFDAIGLRCFPQLNNTYKEAFEYFYNSNELTTKSNANSKKIKLNPLLKDFIKEALRDESKQLATEYEHIADVYNQCIPFTEKLSEDEFNVVRNLAYFKCFDKNFGLENTFKTDVHLAKNFISKYSEWFIQNKYTLSLKQEYSEPLMKYNKLADLEKFNLKIDLIKDAWDDYSQDAINKSLTLNAELEKITSTSEEIQNDIKFHKKNYLTDQASFFEIENNLLSLRNKVAEYLKKKFLNSAFISLGIGALLAIVGYLFPDLLKDYYTRHAELLTHIQNGVYILSLVGCLFALIYFYKEIMLRMNKEEINKIKSEINKHEKEKNHLEELMLHNQNAYTKSEKELEELYFKINLINQELETQKEILKESFI